MTNDSFKKLYVDELKDLYSAESQLLKALPKMAAAASATELRQGFEKHLKQTEGHVQRLDKIFEALGESPKGKKCVGMEGLVKEGSEVSEEGFEGAVLDAGLIGAAHSSDAGWYITSCALPSIDPTGNHLLVSCGKFGRLDRGRFTAVPAAAPQTDVAAAW